MNAMPVAISKSRSDDSTREHVSASQLVEAQLSRLELLAESLEDAIKAARLRDNQLVDQLSQHTRLLEKIERQLGAGVSVPPDSAVAETRPAAESPAPAPGEDTQQFDQAVGLEAASFLKGWQQQRNEMLQRMSTREPTPTATRTQATDLRHQPSVPAVSELLNASPEELSEIQQLRDQLNQAMRDTEIELSRERARISNDRLELDRREAEIRQREMEVSHQASHNSAPVKDGRLARLRKMLGGSGKQG